MMDIKEGQLLRFIIFFDKKSKGSGVIYHQSLMNTQLKNYTNQLLEHLKKEKFILDLKIIFGGADLADMQLMSKFNKRFIFLLCVIDIFSKYAWFVPLKDKKGITITDAFQKILDDSNRKPNKIWVDKEVNFTIIFLKNG